MTLTGAYGRKYGSLAAALKDWNAGKDFRVHGPTGSTYCSRQDFEKEGEETLLQIRWGIHDEFAAGIRLDAGAKDWM